MCLFLLYFLSGPVSVSLPFILLRFFVPSIWCLSAYILLFLCIFLYFPFASHSLCLSMICLFASLCLSLSLPISILVSVIVLLFIYLNLIVIQSVCLSLNDSVQLAALFWMYILRYGQIWDTGTPWNQGARIREVLLYFYPSVSLSSTSSSLIVCLWVLLSVCLPVFYQF